MSLILRENVSVYPFIIKDPMTHKGEGAVLSWSMKNKEVYLSSYEVCCFMDGQSPKENVRVSAPWVGVNLLLGKVLQIVLFRASEPLQWYPLLFFLPSTHYFSRLCLFCPTLAFRLVIFFVMWCSQSSKKHALLFLPNCFLSVPNFCTQYPNWI